LIWINVPIILSTNKQRANLADPRNPEIRGDPAPKLRCSAFRAGTRRPWEMCDDNAEPASWPRSARQRGGANDLSGRCDRRFSGGRVVLRLVTRVRGRLGWRPHFSFH